MLTCQFEIFNLIVNPSFQNLWTRIKKIRENQTNLIEPIKLWRSTGLIAYNDS